MDRIGLPHKQHIPKQNRCPPLATHFLPDSTRGAADGAQSRIRTKAGVKQIPQIVGNGRIMLVRLRLRRQVQRLVLEVPAQLQTLQSV